MSRSHSSFDYDLFVIGGGSAGIAAAKRAASYGVRVGLAEPYALGGTCVNRGCVPKKLMLYATDFARQFAAAQGYGWAPVHSQLNWDHFKAAMHQHMQHLNQVYLQKLKDAGVELWCDRAQFLDPHQLQVGDRKLSADKIVIAVGGHPIRLDIPGMEHAITSKEMFELPQVPERMAVLGGGYIGVEFGCMMQALGTEVTLMDTEPLILDRFDDEVRQAVQAGICQNGIQVLTQTTIEQVQPEAGALDLCLSNGKTLRVDTLLCAVGRAVNLDGLGLEAAGVAVQDGAIAVDQYSQTSQSHIFAAGDCTDRVPLTPVAIAEGHAIADTLFGDTPRSVDYQWVPSGVFSRPEAAMVGFTEQQGRDQFGDQIQCYKTRFTPLFHSLTHQDEQVLIKLVVDAKRDRIVGAHMVGKDAAETIQVVAAALQQGISLEQLQRTIGIHPTVGEELFSMA